jgi:Fe-S-cluster formation regulator IscX/YfhJ
MKKPKFLHLKGFDEDPFTCDENVLLAWLETTHKMKV